ncbi:hypothetical protein [Streptomyces corynorhini]|uniref:Uncharacterized protein n=1 Tax=Streptomyces corynorhini TaxID=2282652 RepID=A0A370B820_9ACTN|nr:hypothetical protein [Streptomyces corynorhini]RDG37958.1 hypothetical protein DVH02_11585 [Streptomyces corynorhini]
MVQLLSETYPQLWLPTLRIKFRDGHAEVGEETAERILARGIDGVRLAPSTVPDDAGSEQGAPAPDDEGGSGEDPGPEPAEPDHEGEPDPSPPSGDGGGPGRPGPRDSKESWLAYADHQDPGDHTAMTKAQLIATYGG